MSFHVKICGLKDPAMAELAVDAGADMIGLVFFPKSPRHLTITEAASVAAAARPRAATVGLFVDPEDDLLADAVTRVSPTHLQLHGSESPNRVRIIRERFNLPVLKAIGIGQQGDVDAASVYQSAADFLLFDTKPPADADLPGGLGNAFDRDLLRKTSDTPPWLLAGGLTPDNVADAVRAVASLPGFAGVDVSSGVERQRGEKDAGLIRDFVANARAAMSSIETKDT